MVIYVDVLVFLNTLVTYFLILSVCHIFRSRPKTYRIIIGSLFGGACSLVIFLPSLGLFTDFLIKLATCVLIVFATFSYHNKARFLKYSLAFLAVSYAYAGSMLAIWFMLKPASMAVGNCVVYFNISPLVLIICTVVCYLFIRLFTSFKTNSQNENLIYTCIISNEESTVSLNAIADTGNSLCDPYFGSPVAVFYEKDLAQISENEKTFLIPFSTVSGSGVISAFRPKKFEILIEGKPLAVSDITIGLCKSKVHNQFDGLINPSILEYIRENEYEAVFKN